MMQVSTSCYAMIKQFLYRSNSKYLPFPNCFRDSSMHWRKNSSNIAGKNCFTVVNL